MRYVVFLLVIFSASPCRAEPPKLFREKSYNCADLAEAVNHYIDLGEKQAVNELNSLTFFEFGETARLGYSRNERVGWVCRILFMPKENELLRPPLFGEPLLPLKTMPEKSWPLLPVVAVGKSYLVLGEIHIVAGLPETGKDYIKYCQTHGKFRTERVAVPTKDQALKDLQDLRKSAAWKAIKWTETGPGNSYSLSEVAAWEFLLKQTEGLPQKK